jgi:hypothetical protein
MRPAWGPPKEQIPRVQSQVPRATHTSLNSVAMAESAELGWTTYLELETGQGQNDSCELAKIERTEVTEGNEAAPRAGAARAREAAP